MILSPLMSKITFSGANFGIKLDILMFNLYLYMSHLYFSDEKFPKNEHFRVKIRHYGKRSGFSIASPWHDFMQYCYIANAAS